MNDSKPPILRGCSVLPAMEPARHVAASTGYGKSNDNPKRTATTSNRFGELNSFVDCSMTDLSRAEALTWLVLWRDTKQGTVRTSMLDVARRIGTTRRAVVDAVGKLEKRGFLIVVYRGGMKRGANVNRVHPIPKPPD